MHWTGRACLDGRNKLVLGLFANLSGPVIIRLDNDLLRCLTFPCALQDAYEK